MKKSASCIISVLINLMLFFTSLLFMAISFGMTDYWERYPIYIPELIMCIAFIVIALAVPFTANFLLYRFWYKKFGISKLWVAVPLSFTYLVLVYLLSVFIFFIPDWA